MTQNFSNLVNLQQASDVKIKLERLQFSAIANISNGVAKIFADGQTEIRQSLNAGVYNIDDIKHTILSPLLKDTKLKFSIKKNELKGIYMYGHVHICRLLVMICLSCTLPSVYICEQATPSKGHV